MLKKRICKAYSNIDKKKNYFLKDAINILKENSMVKFDEGIDIAINLDLDVRKADQKIRGVILLPNGTGKKIRVAVFAKNEKAEAAKKAGADIVGDEDLINKVKEGYINFDKCIATPDLMPLVGSIGKILGPKGLMPNPKLGTVTFDVAEAVKDIKNGQIEYQTEKKGIIHAGIGRVSFSNVKLTENIKVFIDAIIKAKPSGSKGKYVKSIFISSSMGPSMKVSLADLS